ncbi:pseudouridine synthase [Limnohabitans sp. JirII-31]|uniref:pseudouridine synthase n=1 Tax=Limnohabitans sp. JirII-31 TaxID=1977908 RepID=UPI000C1DD39B|nr:pseudouridine synthase [Limnohabitans sp. JirII-31]PIT79544.1 pseudouridine synthase [Limnohabitans sp. JirII-31]
MARPPSVRTIPTRDGVSPSCVALPPGPWATVLDFLAERLPTVPRLEWSKRLANGEVLDEHGHAVHAEQPYASGTRLFYYRHIADEPDLPVQERIVFQDDHLVVADKPHFMPVTPGGQYVRQSLLVRLKRQLGIDSLSPVHRIDRETAGLVLLCVRPQDRNAYQALFRERQVHKVYEAVAPYRAELTLPLTRRSRIEACTTQFFRSEEIEGTPNSETTLSLLQVQGNSALYRLEPVTGKRHQLRIHMQALGLPIEGDQFYPQVLRNAGAAEDFSQPLQLLARSLTFTDPVTGKQRSFTSGQSLRMAV